MDLVVQHLYSLGHRKIGLLTKRFSEDLVPDKIRGFDESMRRLGLDARLRICEDDPNPTKQDYTAEILRLLATADAPTAFVAFNDYQLEDFLQVHREHGVRIPEDVSLAGYGDSYLSRFAGLTTVCQHPDLIGRAVAERLLGHLDDPTLPTTKVKLPSKLVVRNSTAAPKR
jgi:LacI family transcriptional regulator